MPNPIKPKRSYTPSSVPLATDLQPHEMAVNWNDGKIFTKTAAGSIVSWTLGSGGGGGGTSWVTAPASATASGTAGQMAYDGSYFYVATATNTWVRTPLSTWVLPVISISSQPSNQTASGGAATFSVTASVTQSATLSYQWQKSTNSGSTWSDISGATSASLTLSSLTSSDNNSQYRVIVSATGGATSVTSSAATLTVSAFSATAVLLTSGTSYTVPAGASSMKAWAVGGGSLAVRGGAAGGCAFKTWSVTSGQTISYSVAPSITGRTGSVAVNGQNTTVTYAGTTITGFGATGNASGAGSSAPGSFSGGDGGATGGVKGDTSGGNFGGAVGGNGTVAACGRRAMTDVSGLLAALSLAGVDTTERCNATAAFGSGGWGSKYSAPYVIDAGFGGGSGFEAGNYRNSAAGGGAVVLYFT